MVEQKKYKNDTEKFIDLVPKLLKGEIKIPVFQRNYVWTKTKICDFLNSIKDGDPIGNFIFWNSNENIETRNEIVQAISTNVHNGMFTYIIDGQQRFSTLISLFFLDELKKKKVNISRFEKIIYSVTKNEFIVLDKNKRKNEIFLELKEFFSNNNEEVDYGLKKLSLIEEKIKNSESWDSYFVDNDIAPAVSKISNIFKKIKDLSIGILNLSNFSLDDAISLYQKINTRGVKLTIFDIVFAKWNSSSIQINLENKIDNLKFSKDFSSKNEKLIDNQTIIDSLFLVVDNKKPIINSAKKISWPDNREVNKSELNETVDKWSKSIELATFFLEQIEITGNNLPSENIFKWIVYLFYKNNNLQLNAIETKIIKKYIATISLNNFYSSSTNQKLEENIKWINDFLFSEDKEEFWNEFKSQNQRKLSFSIDYDFFLENDSNNMVAKLMAGILHKNSSDFMTNRKINYYCELHHIYPKNGYKEDKYEKINDYINSFANLTPINEATNKNISKKRFSKYHEEYKTEHNNDIKDSLNTHYIDEKLWLKDDNFADMKTALMDRSVKLGKLFSKKFGVEFKSKDDN